MTPFLGDQMRIASADYVLVEGEKLRFSLGGSGGGFTDHKLVSGPHCQALEENRGVRGPEGQRMRCCTWAPSPRDALPREEVLVTGGEEGRVQEVGCL